MNLDPEALSRLSRALDRQDLLAEQIRLQEILPEAVLEACLREANAAGGDGGLGTLLVARGHLSAERLRDLEGELESLEETRSVDDSPPPRPRRLGRYEVLEPLGEGGAGVVFRARDAALGRDVAVKILKTVHAGSAAGVERFEREIRNAARLHHPNIAAVYDAGRDGDVLYYAMELVPGRPLAPSAGDLSGRIRVLEKVARAVQYAHEQGIIHRDLKPLNILLDERGEPRLLDFGLSRDVDVTDGLTRSGAPMGTPLYMAPEQVRGRTREIGPRTDVYALGAILYEMLTGRPPHPGSHVSEIYGRILEDDPVPPRRLDPTLPVDLETVVLKALAKEPGGRYATARDFADELAQHLAGEPVRARPEGRLGRWGRRIRRRPAVHGLAAGLALALAAVAAIGLSRHEKDRALEAERDEALRAFRETARVSLEAALRVRRAGDTVGMKAFLPPLESAYRDAVDRAPRLADIEHYMGRMYRALMQDERALDFQHRALAKDASYAPALYERIVLRSKEYSRIVSRILDEEADAALPGEAVRLGESILDDARALQARLEQAAAGGPTAGVSPAHGLAARGIFTAYAAPDEPEPALRLLQQAVVENPLLEEAWETLGQLALREAQKASSPEEKKSRWALAERWFTEGLRLDEGYLPHHVGRGHARTERARFLQNSREDFSADFQGALDDFSRALALDPGYAEAWMRRGRLHGHRAVYLRSRGNPVEDYREAERDLGEAIRLDASYGEAWMRRGRLRVSRGTYFLEKGGAGLEDLEAADADFTRAIGLGIESGMIRIDRAMTRYKLGHALQAAGRKERARKALYDALVDLSRATARTRAEEEKFRDTAADCRRRLAELGTD